MNAPRPAAVIVLAAGEGTRMKSSTPKVLHRIGGTILLGHAVRAARATQAEHVSVVVRHERDRVVEFCSAFDPEPVIADQDDVKGTGRAVECGLDALPPELSGTVLVTYGDVPLLTGDDPRRAHRRRTPRSGSAVIGPHRRSRRPHRATAGSSATPTGDVAAIVEEKDATAEQRRDPRDQLRHLRLRRRVPARGAGPDRQRQRQGRVLPHRRRRDRPRGRAAPSAPHRSTT